MIATCTVVRSNVYGLHDLLDWAKDHGVYVRYRVAEFIRRLYNDSCDKEVQGLRRASCATWFPSITSFSNTETNEDDPQNLYLPPSSRCSRAANV